MAPRSGADPGAAARSWGGGKLLAGAARDSLTDAAGVHRIAGAASIRAEIGADGSLLRLEPALPGADHLLGLAVGSGFRAELAKVLPGEAASHTPMYLLLDDLPVAALISGYADMYAGRLGRSVGASILRSRAGICAGWAAGGQMLEALDADGELPTPVGPPAPPIEAPDDPDGWHATPRLAPGAMRRRRLIEVVDRETDLGFAARFRDTHVGEDGVERILHEYVVEGSIDRGTGVLARCRATPQVLPWPECPAAAATAGSLVGRTPSEVVDHVRRQLRGTATCTHLNDLLRSLASIVPLARLLGTGDGAV